MARGRGTATGSMTTLQMRGATETLQGIQGSVPAPVATDQNSILKGDATWASHGVFITSDPAVPFMTSATAPSGFVVTASSELDASHEGWQAMGATPSTASEWATAGTPTGSLTLTMVDAKAYTSVLLRGRADDTSVPLTYSAEASNDGFVTKTTLYKGKKRLSGLNDSLLTFHNEVAYTAYRFNILTSSGVNPGLNKCYWGYSGTTAQPDQDFWRSNAGTTVPDGISDTTDGITHTGMVALGRDAPATAQADLHVGGSSVFGMSAIANSPTDGVIGAATATVDVASGALVTQTTANIALTLPDPTLTVAGRMYRVANTGTQQFTIQGYPVPAGRYIDLMWSGAVWMTSEASLVVLQKGMGGPDGPPNVPAITGATQGSGAGQYVWTAVTEDTIGVRKTHSMFFNHWEIDGPVVLDYTGIMGSVLSISVTRSEPEVEFAIGGVVTAGNILTINRSNTLNGSTPFFLVAFGV
jgi:hypothetical protein